ncbi:MAG: hypothetical protein AABW53_00045 [Nanoarchaeota archaeon]
MSASSILCQMNGGCMGCCGHDFESKEKIKEAIFKNTLEFKHAAPQTEKEFQAFRERFPSMDLRHGVCRNLIEENGRFLCPLHPARHGKDLRAGHCEIDYLCKTAKEFENWDEDKKKKFIRFVEEKKLDHVDYSVLMDNDSLLEEFDKQ